MKSACETSTSYTPTIRGKIKRNRQIRGQCMIKLKSHINCIFRGSKAQAVLIAGADDLKSRILQRVRMAWSVQDNQRE
jgi:hypothetical protein